MNSRAINVCLEIDYESRVGALHVGTTLLAAHAFKLLVMEIDLQDNPPWSTVEQFSCLMSEYNYEVLLKMCARPHSPPVAHALGG